MAAGFKGGIGRLDQHQFGISFTPFSWLHHDDQLRYIIFQAKQGTEITQKVSTGAHIRESFSMLFVTFCFSPVFMFCTQYRGVMCEGLPGYRGLPSHIGLQHILLKTQKKYSEI